MDSSTESTSEFLFFSSDLSWGLVEPTGETPLSTEATERTLYVRNDSTGDYVSLVTDSNVPAGIQFGGQSYTDKVHGSIGTPDLSHVLLESQVPLTSNAKRISTGENLYEWVDGRLSLVSVLPDGTPSSTGGQLGDQQGRSVRHALSNDSSQVFWTPLTGGDKPLYMRDTVAGRTVQVDTPEAGVSPPPKSDAAFQIASTTGSKVLFLDEEPLTMDSKLRAFPTATALYGEGSDLYVYDTEAKAIKDLTVNHSSSELANVQNEVLGASEDGSTVYFVATGALASGAEAGRDNLYVVSEIGSTWSAPRLIAVLSQEDAPTWGASSTGGLPPESGSASRVSPNGRFLTFMSDRSLTGYDNRDANSGQPDEEVFVYDETSGHLTCASCNPTGARPTGVFEESGNHLLPSDRSGTWLGHWLGADIPVWDRTHGTPPRAAYQSRYLIDEGRLFFNSFDSLVAQDTNGRTDVYEYEPLGVGGCGRSSGCVSLISSGTSSEESTFLDASGKGPGGEEAEDVFFLTASRLSSQDYDTSLDVYGAHVCSNAAPCVATLVSSPECSSGDSCKAAPSLQPEIFGPAPSATFSGTGNVSASPSAPVVTVKSLTATQKLARALKACRKKKKRAACKRDARKRYGTRQSEKAKATKKGNR